MLINLSMKKIMKQIIMYKKVKFCQKTLFFYYEYGIIKLPRRDTGVIKPTKWLIRESELVGGVEYLNLFKDPKAYYGMPTCTYV